MFEPKLEILPDAQRALWAELAAIPSEFVLCGGTAIALQLGHRQSVDFDFFVSRAFDPARLYSTVPLLAGSTVLQQAANTLTCRVDRADPVIVSFFGVPTLRRVAAPLIAHDNHLRIASLLDLAGMKAAVVQQRAEAKDYIDLHALLESGIGFPASLAAATVIYGERFNPQLTLKAGLAFIAHERAGADHRRRKERGSRSVAGTASLHRASQPMTVDGRMHPLPDVPELHALARRVVWFKSPGDAIAMPAHLVAHVLTYGTHEDVSVLRRFVSDDDLREALASAPAGVFDNRSWAYWHLELDRYPPPPLPSRMFGQGG